jgi:RHS repeat-associated protein
VLFSGKWFDPVIGIDIHLIQPPGPVPPIPVPHPFIGIVYDPAGLLIGMAINAAISGLFGGSFSGPVLINGMPAANTGMHVKGMPVHIPIGGTFVNPPSNEGTIITGSKTVHVLGTSGARLTSMVITCNDPVNLPTSVVMSIPMGAPVYTGGPTAVDWMAVALSAIRTKWVSDKLHDLLGAEPGSWRSKIICFFTGHPVEVVSGRVMTDFADFELPGSIPFKFERSYCSASQYDGPLGHGWHHCYDQHISLRSGRTFFRLGDGREISCDRLEVGERIYDPVERLSISREADSFVVRTIDRRTLTFRPELPDGRFILRRIEDRNRNTINLEYIRGVLASITDCGGRVIRIENDSSGRIIAIVVPHPDLAASDLRVARFEYNSEGDLIAAYDALGHAYRYEYQDHRLVKETNRRGLSFYFDYDSEGQDARCVHTWGDGGIYDHKLTFCPAAHITIVENSLGAKTTYHWNDLGLVTKVVDAQGGQRTFGWDRFCRKTFEKDPEGHTKTWEYTEEGLLTRFTNAMGVEMQLEYTDSGLPAVLVDAMGRRWVRDYDAAGNITAAGLQGDSLWRYQRDGRGNVVVITNPAGYSRTLAYDRAGLIVSGKDYEGNVAYFRRNGFGLLTEYVDAKGNITRRGYDYTRNLVRVRRADGTEVRFEYDPEGNRVSRCGADGAMYTYEYGPLSQLKSFRRPSGTGIDFVYDSEGNLRILVNEQNQYWQYKYDTLGHVVQERDFGGRTLRYGYDLAGALRKRVTGNGDMTDFERNPLGQLVSKRSSDGTFAEFEYDAEGLLSGACNQWTTVRLERDAYGRVVRETQGPHFIASSYDPRGLRTERRTSTGRTTKWIYNRNGDLEKLFLSDDTWLSFSRDELGREAQRKLANTNGAYGFCVRREYDSLSRVTKQVASVELGQPGELRFAGERIFHYDWSGRLVGTEESSRGTVKYSYDADGHVREAIREKGRSERFQYDSAGRLVSGASGEILRGFDHPESKRIDPGRQDEQLNVTRTDQYDDDGRLTEKRVGDRTWRFEWTAESLLRSVVTSSGERWLYEYDPFGRRISKTGPGGTTRYIWDRTGIAEEIPNDASAKGPSSWIYEPRSFRPLAKLHNDTAYLCVTDHLGTPVELVSSDGKVGWSARLTTWGELEQQEVSSTGCPIRFQGQWWDQESGLHYNLNRYYDPTIGAYISSDPIGRLGGTRPYGYAHSPLNWVDPLGLASNSLFRGDDGYGRGDPMGLPMGSDADITTPWDHVRKDPGESSIFTSFAETKNAADKFGDDVYKVSREELEKLAESGQVELYTPQDVYDLMMMDADAAVRADAKNVREIMEKNEEILVEGEIPADIIKKCK